MKTYSAKSSETVREWVLFDASEAPLGRLATNIAEQLMGKHKPTYTPHIDAGNFVVVINAEQLVVTGDKLTDKTYYRHSQYPGGIKSRSLREQMDKDSTRVIRDAVKGMLPKNKLQPDRMVRLKIFPGASHVHEPQQPRKLEVKR